MTSPKIKSYYQKNFVSLMAYTNKLEYDNNHAFSTEDGGAMTPEHIHRWMCFKAYGKEEVLADNLPRLCRSASLEVYKKISISWYMPNHIMAWDCLANRGNPSKSIEVNDLIKSVLCHECGQQGAQSWVKRAFTMREFVKAINILYTMQNFQQSIRTTTMMKYQYH
jgi:hypothetical protein